MKNEKGFTLIEMMIVMLIISVLLMITIPNVTRHNSTINKKGCEAYVKMIESQVQAYEVEYGRYPVSLDELIAAEYIKKDGGSCPDGRKIILGAGGVVSAEEVE